VNKKERKRRFPNPLDECRALILLNFDDKSWQFFLAGLLRIQDPEMRKVVMYRVLECDPAELALFSSGGVPSDFLFEKYLREQELELADFRGMTLEEMRAEAEQIRQEKLDDEVRIEGILYPSDSSGG